MKYSELNHINYNQVKTAGDMRNNQLHNKAVQLESAEDRQTFKNLLELAKDEATYGGTRVHIAQIFDAESGQSFLTGKRKFGEDKLPGKITEGVVQALKNIRLRPHHSLKKFIFSEEQEQYLIENNFYHTDSIVLHWANGPAKQ